MAGDILHFAQAFFLEFSVSSPRRETQRAGGRRLGSGSRCAVQENILICASPPALHLECRVAGGGIEEVVRLFFQNFQRNFVQDLCEGYRQAFGNDFSEMFMIWEGG